MNFKIYNKDIYIDLFQAFVNRIPLSEIKYKYGHLRVLIGDFLVNPRPHLMMHAGYYGEEVSTGSVIYVNNIDNYNVVGEEMLAINIDYKVPNNKIDFIRIRGKKQIMNKMRLIMKYDDFMYESNSIYVKYTTTFYQKNMRPIYFLIIRHRFPLPKLLIRYLMCFVSWQ